ncbi:Membrane protein involved in the export of O-antigen and teichoic acid [Granulicatella balaenopterae]|uniref:Membrane protein involved in the export of O-antigen and teichoic acid n=1 Tax=Granulicatella balaenopterae TaxID=137733 RepID=A0A1H9K981_9LACT|nr:lipopolysaccharide biosynthesis protein [Granulicatella balaenopterae]SEQ95691.1 Membrane protein involved in the export of O-antigen and teichoic acid [Granulicatella balaenopterae]
MNNKSNIFSNFIWRFAERSGAQIVQFIVSIILARILSPSDYGTLAIVMVFIYILQVFVDSGLGSALVQKKAADDLDFSSVFFFNMFVCTLLYGMVFVSAPFIANFYNNPALTSITRVLALMLIISGLKNVQQAYVSRTLQFKKFFFATSVGTIIAAIVGVWMAYSGFGIWSLVGQKLINMLIDTIVLWFTVNWRPKFMFSFNRLIALISYGWKLLVSALLDTLYTNIRSLVIGKSYSASDLAFYDQGNMFPKTIVSNINAAIDSVLFPVMSKSQDDRVAIKNMTRRAIKVSTYIMAPMMIGLATIATPLVSLVLTDKWLSCVFFMRIFCITYMFYPIHTANLNAIKAMGHSDIFLKLEIIKKVIGLIVLFATMWINVRAIAYGALFTSFTSQIINTWPNKKLLDYSYLEQLKDILPSILLALVMGFAISFLSVLSVSKLVLIIIQIILGAIIYIIGSKVLKLDSFQYLLGIIKGRK